MDVDLSLQPLTRLVNRKELQVGEEAHTAAILVAAGHRVKFFGGAKNDVGLAKGVPVEIQRIAGKLHKLQPQALPEAELPVADALAADGLHGRNVHSLTRGVVASVAIKRDIVA